MKHRAPTSLLSIAALLGLAALLVFIVHRFDLQPHVASLAQWVDGLGPWAPVAFIAIDALVVVLVLPGVLSDPPVHRWAARHRP